MDNLFKWLKNKKNWKWMIICAFIIFFVPLIIIHLLFKIPYINEFFKPEWSAGELLGYLGAFYTLLGTAIFSCLALWQNYSLRKKTEEYQILKDEKEMLSNMPDLKLNFSSYSGQFNNLEMSISNFSDNIAKTVRVINLKIVNNSDQIIVKEDKLFERNNFKGEERFNVNRQPLDGKNLIVSAVIQFEDKYSDWHEFKTLFHIADANIMDWKTEVCPITNIDNPLK